MARSPGSKGSRSVKNPTAKLLHPWLTLQSLGRKEISDVVSIRLADDILLGHLLIGKSGEQIESSYTKHQQSNRHRRFCWPRHHILTSPECLRAGLLPSRHLHHHLAETLKGW